MSVKNWDKNNRTLLATSLYHTSDSDIIEFLENIKISKNAFVKIAIREYMKNHPIDDFSKRDNEC